MLKHVSPSDWTVYIALGELIIYIARDGVYVHMRACRCSHLCGPYCAFSFHCIIIQP